MPSRGAGLAASMGDRRGQADLVRPEAMAGQLPQRGHDLGDHGWSTRPIGVFRDVQDTDDAVLGKRACRPIMRPDLAEPGMGVVMCYMVAGRSGRSAH